MTINGIPPRTPHAMQPQAAARPEQARAHGAMAALAGASFGAAPLLRQSSAPPVTMKMPR